MWGPQFTGKIIKINTDNEAVSVIVNTGRSKDLYLQAQLRELTWWLAKYQFRIKAVHLLGKLNRVPDMLSRWEESADMRRQCCRKIEELGLTYTKVDLKMFKFKNNW